MDHAAIASNLSTKVNRGISCFRTEVRSDQPLFVSLQLCVCGCCVSLFRTDRLTY